MSNSDQPYSPKTLIEAVTYFADKQAAFKFAVSLRWPTGVLCPFCDSSLHNFVSTRQLWKCKACKKQFSVKVGTIFEDSPISLGKWFVAIWMLVNCKNGVSSYELHRAIGVTQKTAWFMLHRVRAAVKAGSFNRGQLKGVVEADECHIGGLLKNMHRSRRDRIEKEVEEDRERRASEHPQLGTTRETLKGAGPALGKTLVQAIVERNGEVRAQILQSFGTRERSEFIKANVEEGSHVMTDTGNAKLGPEFIHEFINHQEEYVRGKVHTNSVENFWALLQRGLTGTYVSVEPFHLSAYVDEQCFRFNNRKDDDGGRFVKALALAPTARLTYKQLIKAN